MQSGLCTEYLAPAPGRPLEIVEVSAAARHGDSGGPILNSRGEMAGVLFGEGGGRTDGSYCGRVHKFLETVRRRFAAPANRQHCSEQSSANNAGSSKYSPCRPTAGLCRGPIRWRDWPRSLRLRALPRHPILPPAGPKRSLPEWPRAPRSAATSTLRNRNLSHWQRRRRINHSPLDHPPFSPLWRCAASAFYPATKANSNRSWPPSAWRP